MRLLVPIIFAVLSACWLLFFTAGGKLATVLGTRFGSAIQRGGKGKIADPTIFTYERGKELLLLLTALFLMVVLLRWLAGILARRRSSYSWIYNSLAIFVALNILVGAAMKTALFWGAMFSGSRTANYTQFQFKRALVNEHRRSFSALLLGSSQTQAQIDENQLNSLLGTNLWTTELHFPGSAGLDLFLVYDAVRNCRADFLVIYLSENYFFNGLHTEAPPYFARLEEILTCRSLGLNEEVVSKPFRYGYFAQLIPLFGAREALTSRLLGPEIGLLGQTAHDSALQIDLEKRAETVRELFGHDAYVAVHKRAVEEFVRRASADGRRVIILEGQLNPVLAEKLPPDMRKEMKEFLRELVQKYPAVELVSETDLPQQGASDYADLTHVTPAAQARFTAWLADFMQGRVASVR